MRLIVLTNTSAGAGDTSTQALDLRAAFEAVGVDADVREVRPDDLAQAAQRAADEASRGLADAVVAAGGDGTISTVAAALAGRDIPLGIIPAGTLNHFAKDLAVPLEPTDAAGIIAAGHTRRVDLAEVNGRTFINNSSIGLYPHIVGKRDSVRARLGRNKWLATLMALISVFRRYPTVRVRIGVGDETALRTTPFVFVGSNRYEINLTMLGRRQQLDGGSLCLYFTSRTGRFGLFRLALRALLGRLEQARDFDALSVTEAWIETPKKILRVALDGEVIRLSPPLHYRIRPAALMVLAPPAPREPAASPRRVSGAELAPPNPELA